MLLIVMGPPPPIAGSPHNGTLEAPLPPVRGFFIFTQGSGTTVQPWPLFKRAAYALLTPLPPSQHPRPTYRDTADTSDPRQLRGLGIFQVCGRASHLGSDISQGS